MKFLYQMFSDVQGDPSTNRLISAFVAVFPLLVWGYSVYKAGVWISPPEEVLLLVGGGLTSKIVQRKVEQSHIQRIENWAGKKEKEDGN